MSQATSFFALSNTGRCKNMITKKAQWFSNRVEVQ